LVNWLISKVAVLIHDSRLTIHNSPLTIHIKLQASSLKG